MLLLRTDSLTLRALLRTECAKLFDLAKLIPLGGFSAAKFAGERPERSFISIVLLSVPLRPLDEAEPDPRAVGSEYSLSPSKRLCDAIGGLLSARAIDSFLNEGAVEEFKSVGASNEFLGARSIGDNGAAGAIEGFLATGAIEDIRLAREG
ncbi:hypothetical protein V2G26_004858 [Clonostachys chloroleuca]